MNDVVLYRERLPRYVFKGTQFKRAQIKMVQWWFRLGAIAIFLTTIFLIFIHRAFDYTVNAAGLWLAMILTWVGCIILLYESEFKHQKQLDGSAPTVIYSDRITIPPRLHRRLTSRPDSMHKGEIDHVKVIRGKGAHYIAKKSGVLWKNSPIGIVIVTRSGREFGLGYKPPSTVKEITDVLRTQWNVRIEDPGTGMGMGLRYVNDNIQWERSYEEIMKMDLFEWQE